MNKGFTNKSNKKVVRDLDNLNTCKMARGITLTSPSIGAIEHLLNTASQEIYGLAPLDTILEVYNHNPDTLMCLSRSGPANKKITDFGFVAYLPLNQIGLQLLINGELDTTNPGIEYLCAQNESPAGIYVWCIYVTPFTAGGIALVMERFKTPQNRQANLYCKAANEKAHSFFIKLGFSQRANYDGMTNSELLSYERKFNSEQPAPSPDDSPRYDKTGLLSGGQSLDIEVVHNIDQYQKIVAIRSATYLAEHDCPYQEEFDGNDFCGTHILGQIDGEPAGCIRIRYFSGFAKLERLAVMARYRKTSMTIQLVKAAIELCRKKGYQRLYGHAEPRLLNLWKHFGFAPRTSQPTFSFSDRNYLEGDLLLDLANDPVSHLSLPQIINRPEGQWHRPGILEKTFEPQYAQNNRDNISAGSML